ncbi:hypothetical protein C8R47DRAFT_1068548 [Mycena vitilis]|nr:hypothetical protein C8R47DRAFT_1068548 [Mycena vitilis]
MSHPHCEAATLSQDKSLPTSPSPAHLAPPPPHWLLCLRLLCAVMPIPLQHHEAATRSQHKSLLTSPSPARLANARSLPSPHHPPATPVRAYANRAASLGDSPLRPIHILDKDQPQLVSTPRKRKFLGVVDISDGEDARPRKKAKFLGVVDASKWHTDLGVKHTEAKGIASTFEPQPTLKEPQAMVSQTSRGDGQPPAGRRTEGHTAGVINPVVKFQGYGPSPVDTRLYYAHGFLTMCKYKVTQKIQYMRCYWAPRGSILFQINMTGFNTINSGSNWIEPRKTDSLRTTGGILIQLSPKFLPTNVKLRLKSQIWQGNGIHSAFAHSTGVSSVWFHWIIAEDIYSE